MTAVILFAHGSPIPEANEGVAGLAARVARAVEADLVLPAFLDSARPDLAEAVGDAVAGGARRIVIMPYFLTLGLHLRRDLPQLVERQRARFPEVEILVSESLEGSPAVAEAVAERVRQTLQSRAAR